MDVFVSVVFGRAITDEPSDALSLRPPEVQRAVETRHAVMRMMGIVGGGLRREWMEEVVRKGGEVFGERVCR